MGLEKDEVIELVDRAQSHWDNAKDMPTVEELHAEGDMTDKYSAGRNNEDEEQIWEWKDRTFSVYISSGKGEVPPGAVVSEIFDED
jgi:hypothetical protein